MDYNRPCPNFELEQEWWWPSHKFALPLDDLFGSLYTQYNTVTIPIQDPEAFHHDVYETCTVATTALEFHTLLAERRKVRLEELRTTWHAVASRIAARPKLMSQAPTSKLETADIWADFLYFSREFSFDALVKLFSSFAGFSAHPEETVQRIKPSKSTPQKRCMDPDDGDHNRTKKRRLSEDSDDSEPRTSVEESFTGSVNPKHCTPPSSLPSPIREAVPTPDPADSMLSCQAPKQTHAKVLTPKDDSRTFTSQAKLKTIRRSARIRERSTQAINASCQLSSSEPAQEMHKAAPG